MGGYQGVWLLFPPFKGDSRGLTLAIKVVIHHRFTLKCVTPI
jgi:hypothetical protein